MKLHELQNTYPTISKDCREALRKGVEAAALGESGRKANKTRKARFSLVLAIVLLLALIGAAFAAAQMGLFDYLFYGQEPSEGMTASAQTVTARGGADDVEVTITGAVYDGERVALSWSAENKKPESLALIQLKSISLGGEWLDEEVGAIGMSFTGYDHCLPAVFGRQEATWSRNPVHGGMISSPMKQQGLSGQQEVVMQVRVSRYQKPVLVWTDQLAEGSQEEPPEDMDVDLEWWAQVQAEHRGDTLAMFQAMRAANITVVDRDEKSAKWWWEQGYIVLNEGGDLIFPEDCEDTGWYWEEGSIVYDPEGQMEAPAYFQSLSKDTGNFTIRFSVDADEGKAFRKDAWTPKVVADGSDPEAARQWANGQQIDLPDCTVRMQRLCLTPLSTRIQFQMIPQENTEAAMLELRDTYGWLEITDENGQELDFAGMEYAYESPWLHQTAEGKWVVEWDWTMAGLKSFPREIHLGARAGSSEEDLPNQEQEEAFAAFAEKMIFAQP